MKTVDSTSLPPCEKVLMEKLNRTAYIAQIWKNATLGRHYFEEPTTAGWVLKDGHYRINWFDGDLAPRIIDVIEDDTIEDGKRFLYP